MEIYHCENNAFLKVAAIFNDEKLKFKGNCILLKNTFQVHNNRLKQTNCFKRRLKGRVQKG